MAKSVAKAVVWIFTVASAGVFLFKCVVWLLNAIGNAETAGGLVENRGAIMNVIAKSSQWWPVLAFLAGVFVLCCHQWGPPKYWFARIFPKDSDRGHLHVTVLYFDHNDSELVARIMFYNADSLPRTVIAVTFLYRVGQQRGYEFHSTGPKLAPFIGHIDPVRIPPRSDSDVLTYRAPMDASKFDTEDVEAGLYITFTKPGGAKDSAKLIALRTMDRKTLSVPPRNLIHIENVSLDDAGESNAVANIVRSYRRQRRRERLWRYLLWWRKSHLIGRQ